MSEQVVRVCGLCGSLRQDGFTRRAIEYAIAGARDAGAETELIDLRDYNLTFRVSVDEKQLPDVLRLREAVKAADGIILGTPEYHGSFSGVLKNALDLMGFDEFEGKMIGLVSVSGGYMGGVEGLNSLRQVGRALHAWVIPNQASVPEAWRVFDSQGKLKVPEYEKRLRRVGHDVSHFARLHKYGQALDFMRNWEKAQENPGGSA